MDAPQAEALSPDVHAESGGVMRLVRGQAGRRALTPLLMWAPIVVCVLVMLPRLLSPQFGLLDDPRMLHGASQIAGGVWDMASEYESGRYRPAYWLAWSLVYRLAGNTSLVFYVANLLVFTWITAGLMWFVRLQGGSRVQAWVSGILFALSGPAVEGFYTLSKGEGLQLMWIVACLVLTSWVPRLNGWLRKGAAIAGAALAAWGALSSKETSLAILPFAGAWLLLAWMNRGREGGRSQVQSELALLAASVIALVAFLVLRSQALGAVLSAGSYTTRYSLEPGRLLSSGTRLLGWLLRDFPYAIPLGVYLLFGWHERDARSRFLALSGLVWAGLFTAVFLPWPWTDEFYLLPAAAGFALFGGACAGVLLCGHRNEGSPGRLFIGATVAASIALLLATVPNNVASARIQLVVDTANSEMLAEVAGRLPAGAVLAVNVPEGAEYYSQLQLDLVDRYGRGDLEIRPQGGLADVPEDRSGRPVFILSPVLAGLPYFTVRVGVSEADTAAWIEDLAARLGPRSQMVFGNAHRAGWLNVNLPALLCSVVPGKAYCSVPRDVFEVGVFAFGWRLESLGRE